MSARARDPLAEADHRIAVAWREARCAELASLRRATFACAALGVAAAVVVAGAVVVDELASHSGPPIEHSCGQAPLVWHDGRTALLDLTCQRVPRRGAARWRT